jgi:hypothetical protein
MKIAPTLARAAATLALLASLAGCLPIGIQGSTQFAGAERPAPAAGPVR